METLTKVKGYRVKDFDRIIECDAIMENGKPVLLSYDEFYIKPDKTEAFFLTKQEAESYIGSITPSTDEIKKVLGYISRKNWNEECLKDVLSDDDISKYRHFFFRDYDDSEMCVLDNNYHYFQTAFKGFLTIGNESIRISNIEHIESVQNFDEKEPTIIYLKNGKKIEVTERVQKFILAYIFS